ncbi:DUF4189 domain-containing protein [Xanthomonas pisi]|uniref:DUF4189 domain-containing protein n=1 Tax=Xanthomonas pisi TaxID=56457 RepID=A0A2S7D5J7_9XANT|nr:DUF4189 domain-containing protein [Xanthomonas pisi]PPU69029.1 DUF4189 domain-containing protein [Xanthomonas pisi]
MNSSMIKAKAVLHGSLFFVFFSATALAQTACPIGTAAGSAVCGPGPSTGQGSSSSGSYISAPPPRPSGEWLKTWGAVAQASNGDTGLSSGFLAKKDAISDALSKCENWGATDCNVILTYRNQCIVSIDPADGGGGGAIANASSIEAARKIASDHCEKSGKICKQSFSKCSDPIFRKY